MQPGVEDEQAGEAAGLVDRLAQADGAGPVLHDEVHAVEVEGVDDVAEGSAVPLVAVPGVVGRLVAAPEPGLIDGDASVPGSGEPGQPRLVQVRPRGLAVAEQERAALGAVGGHIDDGQVERTVEPGRLPLHSAVRVRSGEGDVGHRRPGATDDGGAHRTCAGSSTASSGGMPSASRKVAW